MTDRDRIEYAAGCLAAEHPALRWMDALDLLAEALDMPADQIRTAAPDFAELWGEAVGDHVWQREIRELLRQGDTKAAQVEARHRYFEGLPSDRPRDS